MNMKKLLVSLFAGMVGVAALTAVSFAKEVTVTDKSELQNVINDAEPGDTVLVTIDPGAFTINKPITVKGVNDADGKVGLVDYQYITIAEGIDGKVVIDNLAFNGTTNHIIVFSGNDFTNLDLTINDCYIEYNGNRGIYVDKELEALTVSGCTIDNKAASYVSSYAIWTNPTAPATMNITDNEIKGADALRGAIHIGDYATNGSEITISENRISGVERGVQIANQSDNVDITIEDNTFTSIKLCEGSTKAEEECAVIFLHENATTNLDMSVVNNTATDTKAIIYSENTAETEEFIADFTSNTLNNDFVDVNGSVYVPVAAIGNTYYKTLQAAIDAADDGDTITIYAGTYDAFTVTAEKNNLTFVGETDADGNNLVTIRTLEEDIDTQTKGIYVQAEKATFKNLNIVSGSALVKWLCSALGATNNSVGLGHSDLNELVLENCNFKGDGSTYAVWARACDIIIKKCTFDGYTKPIEFYALGTDQTVAIIDSEITNASQAIRAIEGQEGSLVKLENSVISAEQITINKYGKITINDSTIEGAYLAAYGNSELNVTNSALYDTVPYTAADTASVSLSAVYANNVNDLAEAAKAENITFATYYPTYEDFENKTGLKDVPAASDAIYVKFEDKTAADAEGEKIYDINLVATDSEIINRLNSADLTFKLTSDHDMAYEIIASNDEVAINPVNNSADRYEFHYKNKDADVDTDTANTITIGQVKFTGYGKYDFEIVADAPNAAHATTISDNIVDTFVPNTEDGVQNGELVISNKIDGAYIAVPTRDLTINIAFPNSVKDNKIAYQDMTVTVSGGDLAEAIVIELGTDAVETAIATENDKADAKYLAKFENGAYVVTVTDILTVNTAYNVTVEGAGYRTARYNVTMNCEEYKVLNFWNNVKDNAVEVEEDKESSKKNVTFLAGDIVKDAIINIYDLSAVVSYFGEIDLDENNNKTYAKYDLNRDGKIDSKDVAYVLVSWGK